MELLIGLALIALAYGTTLYLFFRSMGIVSLIDREKLEDTREIRYRLGKRKGETKNG